MHSEPEVFTYVVILDIRPIELSAYNNNGDNPSQMVMNPSVCPY